MAEPPLAKDVFGVVRDEQGYILADMGPEVEKMAGHTEESIKKYLRRRGVQLLADKRKTEKPLQSQKSFLVRMIVVVSTDEYDQAQWATAPELAQILFVHPPVEIDAAALNDGDLRKIIQTEKIDLRAYNTVSDP
ncbi:MAG: hypothetical protein JW849_04470 [Phycisphaerae bacterium]|nr:hypothetical protein [Phycisphaerae bacterium]